MTHRGAGIKMAEWENMEITSPYKHIKHLPVEQFSEKTQLETGRQTPRQPKL